MLVDGFVHTTQFHTESICNSDWLEKRYETKLEEVIGQKGEVIGSVNFLFCIHLQWFFSRAMKPLSKI